MLVGQLLGENLGRLPSACWLLHVRDAHDRHSCASIRNASKKCRRSPPPPRFMCAVDETWFSETAMLLLWKSFRLSDQFEFPNAAQRSL
jgi:hypothetical protein